MRSGGPRIARRSFLPPGRAGRIQRNLARDVRGSQEDWRLAA